FTCPAPAFYFLNCEVDYNSATGDLKYVFSGTNPADGDETSDSDEASEAEGIAPGSTFRITLNGWVAGLGDNAIYGLGQPTLTNTFTATPEPGMVGFLVSASLLVLIAAAIKRRRQKVTS